MYIAFPEILFYFEEKSEMSGILPDWDSQLHTVLPESMLLSILEVMLNAFSRPSQRLRFMALIISPALLYLSLGFLSSILAITSCSQTGISGFIFMGATGFLFLTDSIICSRFSPSNGLDPVSIS